MPKKTASAARPRVPAPRVGDKPAGKVARAELRHRTKLREGRLLRLDRSVIADCLFYDISLHGACVRLPADIPVPRRLLVLDGRSEALVPAELRWRKDCHIGLFITDGIAAWG